MKKTLLTLAFFSFVTSAYAHFLDGGIFERGDFETESIDGDSDNILLKNTIGRAEDKTIRTIKFEKQKAISSIETALVQKNAEKLRFESEVSRLENEIEQLQGELQKLKK